MLRHLPSLALSLFVLFFTVGTAEASTRTLSHYSTPGTVWRPLSLVRSGGAVALSDGSSSATSDASVPGSVPLSPSLESRLDRYVNNDGCPVTLDTVISDRCMFLLKARRALRLTKEGSARQSPSARLLNEKVQAGSRSVRRTVEDQYVRDLQTSNRFIRARTQKSGWTGRPRTLNEAGDAFKLESERVRAQRSRTTLDAK